MLTVNNAHVAAVGGADQIAIDARLNEVNSTLAHHRYPGLVTARLTGWINDNITHGFGDRANAASAAVRSLSIDGLRWVPPGAGAALRTNAETEAGMTQFRTFMKSSPAHRIVQTAPKRMMLLISLFLMQNGVADACESLKSCTQSEITKAAMQEGCGLLFIQSRYNNCVSAGKTLHTPESCGPPPPAACGARERNGRIRKRLTKCLKDRKQQASAFASGLMDVETALSMTGFAGMKNKTAKDPVYSALTTIKTAIMAGQPGHAIAITAVKNAIKNCTGFP